MKKLLFLFTILLITACQESLEQRAQRTLKEFSERNCPMPLSDAIMMDSCAFETDTHTLHYYYTFMGAMDNDSTLNTAGMRELLSSSLKNETSVRIFKEAGYSFKYTYFSQSNPGKLLFETTFTKDDYQ
jgi:hypothetical protein